MIQVEIDKFLKADNWSKSEFSTLCQSVMHEVIKEKMTLLLKEKYVSEVWENNEIKPSDAVEKIITENAGKIMLSVVGSMVQQTINNMKI
jgi:hypothetical protein